jgi:phosphoserine phosphatase RsbU/P
MTAGGGVKRPIRRPRIFLVEDDRAGRELLELLLDEAGYLVESAADGQQAWERLQGDASFATLLLDWMLPGLTGLELLERVRADERLSSIPVVFQTARTDRASVIAAVAAGAAYFVPKPIDRELLLTALAAAVAEHGRNLALRERLSRGKAAATTLVEGRFVVRTVEEAAALATALSYAYPEPDRTATGLCELLVNAVEHGNLGITYEEKSALLDSRQWEAEVARRLAAPEHRDKRAEVLFARNAEAIVVTITDCGPGFDWQRYLTISLDRLFDAHGRGIAMANMMSFDRLEYLSPGNRVVATVVCPPAVAP